MNDADRAELMRLLKCALEILEGSEGQPDEPPVQWPMPEDDGPYPSEC